MKNLCIYGALFATMAITSGEEMGRPRSNAISRVQQTDKRAKPSNIDHHVGQHFKKNRQKINPPTTPHGNRSQSTPISIQKPTKNKNQTNS